MKNVLSKSMLVALLTLSSVGSSLCVFGAKDIYDVPYIAMSKANLQKIVDDVKAKLARGQMSTADRVKLEEQLKHMEHVLSNK